MTTMTLEALADAPVGTAFNVNNVSTGSGVWTRTAAGLAKDGAEIPVTSFRGLVRLGHVTQAHPADRIQPGWWCQSGRWRYVTCNRTDNGWRMGAWRDDVWQGWIEQSNEVLGGWGWGEGLLPRTNSLMVAHAAKEAEAISLRDARDQYATRTEAARTESRDLLNRLAQEQAQVQALRQDLAAAREQSRIPDELRDALHQYAADVEDGGFDELLARFDMGREMEHEVYVHLTGEIRVSPTREMVGLSDDFEIEDVDDARIEWSRTVTIVRSGVGCTCDLVSRDDVAGYVPAKSETDWSYSTECGN